MNENQTARIHPVILSGGSGTRLWPASRKAYPKQLLPLASELSLLQETVRRVSDGARFGPPLVVCNEDHRFIVARQIQEMGIAPGGIVLEPIGRNTAPAVAAAALILAETDPRSLLLVLPSDHAIADGGAFREAVEIAARAAADGALVTFGIAARRPETGYGYIRRGRPVSGLRGCYEVSAFVEKPDLQAAEVYVADGGYSWNSGMFLFSAEAFLSELETHAPDILAGCRASLSGAAHDLDFLRLAAEPFAALPSISIDYAVMEKTARAVVVPADIGWSDVGSWAALWEIGAKDGCANVLSEDVIVHDVRRSLIRSDGGRLVTAIGLEDMVVVATDDAVLVLPMDRAQEVKHVVDALGREARKEAEAHVRVDRPWGYFQSLHQGPGFQVKRITVTPGASLSLQKHFHRAEHWVVVDGTARVTRGAETFELEANESAYIPRETIHRLANPGPAPLSVIEVQSGDYLGEDDIVRFEDDYNRADAGEAAE